MVIDSHRSPDQAGGPEHHHFIDWMKCFGIFVIIVGHCVEEPFYHLTPPIYPKQLGVAFFVFLLGWSLANDARPWKQILFNRLFSIILFGLISAFIISAIKWIAVKDINPSNYLPFFLGANVLMNAFPANPTTWYIGTYFHLLLIGTLIFRKIRLSARLLILFLFLEILARILLLEFEQKYVSYMVFSNWISVFLLGFIFRHKKDACHPTSLPPIIITWLAGTILWALLYSGVGMDHSAVFRLYSAQGPFTPFIKSSSISSLYLFHTIMAFLLFTRLKAPKFVRFISRNTLIVFIIHLPLIQWFAIYLYPFLQNYWLSKVVMISLSFLGFSLFSEVIMTVFRIRKLKSFLQSRFFSQDSPSLQVSPSPETR